MPTTKRRHQITESDVMREALELAAEHWPEDAGRPSRLLVRLIGEGAEAIQSDARREKRQAMVGRYRGAFADAYPVGYLEEARREWPD
ncbi:MAG TPA: hypothetical protein VGH21_02615 [Solirubrobacteraceae bacterium]|jgi:hypothetical protein